MSSTVVSGHPGSAFLYGVVSVFSSGLTGSSGIYRVVLLSFSALDRNNVPSFPSDAQPASSLPSTPGSFLHPGIPTTNHSVPSTNVFSPRLSPSFPCTYLPLFPPRPSTPLSPTPVYLLCWPTWHPSSALFPLRRMCACGYCHSGAIILSIGPMRKSLHFPSLS